MDESVVRKHYFERKWFGSSSPGVEKLSLELGRGLRSCHQPALSQLLEAATTRQLQTGVILICCVTVFASYMCWLAVRAFPAFSSKTSPPPRPHLLQDLTSSKTSPPPRPHLLQDLTSSKTSLPRSSSIVVLFDF
jgi:hypothetical protein